MTRKFEPERRYSLGEIGEPPPNVLRYATGRGVPKAKAGQPRRCSQCGRWLLPPGTEPTSVAIPAVADQRKAAGVSSRCIMCQRARRANNITVARAYGRARERARRAANAARTDDEIARAQRSRHPDGMKRCRTCKVTLPLSNFSAHRCLADGLQQVCKDCAAARFRRRAEAHWTEIGLSSWQDNKCYICGSPLDEMHIDHIISLHRGGANKPTNLAPACPACNMSKHARDLVDVLLERNPAWQKVERDSPLYARLKKMCDPKVKPHITVDKLDEILAWPEKGTEQ